MKKLCSVFIVLSMISPNRCPLLRGMVLTLGWGIIPSIFLILTGQAPTILLSRVILGFLVLPVLSRTTLNNDLTALNTVAGITFNSGASAFTINGNAINLTGAIHNDSASNEILSTNITTGSVTNSGTGQAEHHYQRCHRYCCDQRYSE